MSRLPLYIDAARRITPSQALGRLRRAVPPALLAAGAGTAPGWKPIAAGAGASAHPQSEPSEPPHTDGVFRALGRERAAGAPGFWSELSDGLLFLFHLHGFERLAEYAASERTPEGDRFWAGLLGSWLDQCDRPAAPAWHPYPTATRVIAWASALSTDLTLPAELGPRLRDSLWRQARYVGRAVERDIGGNHVVRNAVALVVGGAVFESARMRDRGLAILRGEIDAQLLDDGGHKERSTSYHQLVACDLADAAEVAQRAGADCGWLDDAVERMDQWAREVGGPDRRLPLLNDAWEWPAPGPPATTELANLSATGLQIVRHRRDQLIFDVGPLAPDHLPPHAHADALSIVSWIDGEPLLVDPGTFDYTGPLRNEFRGTAAHNTVTVDDLDQCEFWGDFRLAFPPDVRGFEPQRIGELTVLRGTHSGYTRLSSPATHERMVIWWPGRATVIVDRLLGEGRHRATSRLHLAPGLEPDPEGRVGAVRIRPLSGRPAIADGRYSPYLGVSTEIKVLEQAIEVTGGTRFGWSIVRDGVEASVSEGAVELSDGADTARADLD